MCTAARSEPCYQLLIVELLEDEKRLARIIPAEFETNDLDVARTWARHFNEREYRNPVDSWAVIRVLPVRPRGAAAP
ncbi:MAG TPA: hypothetical protein VG125_12445 [Pirellulales bacterium]|jgi:hypothetical protein|nr:hypothetical protein [Pirellulales bacterium]